MGRPRTPIGTFGEIHFERTPSGQVRARARYRDDDGQVRRVSAVGSTQKTAERNLKEQLGNRISRTNYNEITPDSSFKQLVDLWLDDLDLTGKVAESTRALYERNMRQLVLPVFEHYALREVTVGRVDRFLKALAASKSYSTAKQAKTVLSLAFGLAVRYDALRENPVRDTAKPHKPPSQAKALTIEEIEAIRDAAKSWRRGAGFAGPPPDGQLEQIIEVLLGTSARIGEVLAIRKCDAWAVGRYADVKAAQRNGAVFASGSGVAANPLTNRLSGNTVLNSDGEVHARRRGVMLDYLAALVRIASPIRRFTRRRCQHEHRRSADPGRLAGCAALRVGQLGRVALRRSSPGRSEPRGQPATRLGARTQPPHGIDKPRHERRVER
jgi:hypothetical protein